MRFSSAASSTTSRGPASGTRTSPWPALRERTAAAIFCIGRTSRATIAITAMNATARTTASRKAVSSVRSRTGPKTRFAETLERAYQSVPATGVKPHTRSAPSELRARTVPCLSASILRYASLSLALRPIQTWGSAERAIRTPSAVSTSWIVPLGSPAMGENDTQFSRSMPIATAPARRPPGPSTGCAAATVQRFESVPTKGLDRRKSGFAVRAGIISSSAVRATAPFGGGVAPQMIRPSRLMTTMLVGRP